MLNKKSLTTEKTGQVFLREDRTFHPKMFSKLYCNSKVKFLKTLALFLQDQKDPELSQSPVKNF